MTRPWSYVIQKFFILIRKYVLIFCHCMYCKSVHLLAKKISLSTCLSSLTREVNKDNFSFSLCEYFGADRRKSYQVYNCKKLNNQRFVFNVKLVIANQLCNTYWPQLPGRLFSPSDMCKKLSQHFLLHFWIDIGCYDHHAKYQGVFP